MEYEFVNLESEENSSADEFNHRRRHYSFNDPVEYANLTTNEFQQRFRLTPRQIELLILKIGIQLQSISTTNHALSVNQKILITLRFLATNDFYYSIGDTQGPTRNTIMRVIKKTVLVIVEQLSPQIDWPQSDFDCRIIAQRFSKISKPYGMPNVVGAIDGTLVDIVAPANSGGVFIGRYRRTALNVLAVSDGGKKFLFVSAKFPGAVHDQRVFRKTLGLRFEAGWRPFPGSVLLADSAYVGTDYLISMKEGCVNELEKLFYDSFAKTRCTVECLFGIWKNRFQVLKGASGKGPMRFRDPAVSATVVIACAVLQNFLVESRLEEENDDTNYEIELLPEEAAEVPPPLAENADINAQKNRINLQIEAFRRFNDL